MEITLLGTGASQGVPRPGCKCEFCTQIKPGSKSYRKRAGILVKADGKTILVDTSPDVRDHLLSENLDLNDIDAILITHTHHDHWTGLAEFYYGKRQIPVYASKENLDFIKNPFDFLFTKKILVENEIEINKPFQLFTLKITPIELNHQTIPVMGFRIEYNDKVVVIATDTTTKLKEETKQAMKNVDLLIFDTWAENEEEFKKFFKIIYPDREYDPNKKHHSMIDEVKELAKELQPKKIVTTHVGCQAGFYEDIVKNHETEEFIIGYDGIKITL